MKDLMPTGNRKVGQATCRVRRHPTLPARMQERTREIVNLEVPAAEQGKGYATTLMHSVCREADAAGFVLVLTPQPYGDNINLSKSYLQGWYEERFGFNVIQHEPMIMARMPGATPRLLKLEPIAEALQAQKVTLR